MTVLNEFPMKAAVIIVAAGRGKRLLTNRPKQFMALAAKEILAHTVAVFNDHPLIREIVLVVAKNQLSQAQNIVTRNKFGKVSKIIAGGTTRSQSVWQGLKVLSKRTRLVAVHDGVRPLVSPGLINRVIEAAARWQAAVPAVTPKATVKLMSKKRWVAETLERCRLAEIQTPQVFNYKILKDCYRRNLGRLRQVTDDSFLLESAGYKVRLVAGDYQNIKITTAEDLKYLSFLLEGPRIGLGYDIHPLLSGRRLILGGIRIKSARGLYGHSDADVLLHAVCDALLGALGRADLGWHFPDSDNKYKNIDSSMLLKKVMQLVRQDYYRINNLDCVIAAQQPRLQPYRKRMVRKIAQLLFVDSDRVGVKFCSPENIGPLGDSQAIAAMAAVTMIRG